MWNRAGTKKHKLTSQFQGFVHGIPYEVHSLLWYQPCYTTNLFQRGGKAIRAQKFTKKYQIKKLYKLRKRENHKWLRRITSGEAKLLPDIIFVNKLPLQIIITILSLNKLIGMGIPCISINSIQDTKKLSGVSFQSKMQTPSPLKNK